MRDALAIRRRAAIPLTDASALQFALWRTAILRFLLAAAIVALAVVAFDHSRSLQPRPLPFLTTKASTIVVVDQSKSIYAASYRRIAHLLTDLAKANASVGLVAFSDTAYEMMPPGSAGSELAPMIRFYEPKAGNGQNVDQQTLFPASPWQDAFSGGTAISTGLDLAYSIIRRDHVRGGTILLTSDLETSNADEARLARVLILIAHDPTVRLRILPLFPAPVDLHFFRRYIPASDIVKPSQLHLGRANTVNRKLIVPDVTALVAIVALLLVVVAANEFWCARVTVPRPADST